MTFYVQAMKLKRERDLSYKDPLSVEFFQNIGTSSISVILLTNRRKEGRTGEQINCGEFNTSLAEVINGIYLLQSYKDQEFVNISLVSLLE